MADDGSAWEDQYAFMAACAALNGGLLGAIDGIRWVSTGAGSDVHVYLPAQAGDPRAALAEAEGAVDARASIGVWAPGERGSRPAVAALLSRGYRWGFAASWMQAALPLERTSWPVPDGVVVGVAGDTGDWKIKGTVPYFDAEKRALIDAIAASGEPALRYLAARTVRGTLLGLVAVHTGPSGRAALLNLGVVRRRRATGIGAALSAGAAAAALEAGASRLSLNATADGARLYRRLGFADVGSGQTWWRDGGAALPEPHVAEFVAALAFDAPVDPPGGVDGATVLPCGQTAAQVCASTASPVALHGLVTRGVAVDALSAWDVGDHDLAVEIMRAHPDRLAVLDPASHATPLHAAAMRGDEALVRALLAAGAPRDVRDPAFDADPAGWARHFGHEDLARVIEHP